MSQSMKTWIGIFIILVTGILIYLPRLDSLPFRGEEPRRVVAAFEMSHSGNWYVPTIQQQVFLSRPPFQNWIIALTGKIRGNFDHLTGRLPSAIGALLTALLIYFYCLSFLTRQTALLASLFFLTMPQVIQLGRTAETELIFTFLLSGSFLLWHLGDMKKWPSSLKWSIAYLFLACATLTKGLNQAPFYFAAIIGFYLLWNRRFTDLLTKTHLLGIGLFCLIVGYWQWGFVNYLGAKVGWGMHLGDVFIRFGSVSTIDYILHLILYPLELLAVMLPWSLLLPAYFIPSFWLRRLPESTKPIATFCLSAIAVTFLTVWIPEGSRTRYYMPLFPCFAILFAIVIECALKPRLQTEIEKHSWRRISLASTWFYLIIIPAVGTLNFLKSCLDIHWLAPPENLLNATLYWVGTLMIALALLLIIRTKRAHQFYLPVICYALFAALSIDFVYTDSRKAVYNDLRPQLITAMEQLPLGSKLVSDSPVAFEFLYNYILLTGETIPVLSDQELREKLSDSLVFLSKSESAPTTMQIKSYFEIDTGRYKREFTNDPGARMFIGK